MTVAFFTFFYSVYFVLNIFILNQKCNFLLNISFRFQIIIKTEIYLYNIINTWINLILTSQKLLVSDFQIINCCMSSKHDIKSLHDFKQLKSSFVIPLKIKMFYLMLQDVCTKNSQSSISKDIIKNNKLLLSAFKKLSESQQQRFLYESLKLVKLALNKDKDDSNSSESDGMDVIKDIETSCKIRDSFMGFNKWEKKGFKLNTKNYRIKIVDGKRQIIFNLINYFVRKSQKHSKVLVLEAISQTVEASKSQVHILFDDNILFQEIYNHIFVCVIEKNAKQLLKISGSKDWIDQVSTNTNQQIVKDTVILTTKVLNQYFQMKDKIMRKLQNCSYKFEQIQTHLVNTKIAQSLDKNKAKIKIQVVYNKNLEDLSNKLSLFKRKTDNKLKQYQVLQNFSSNINVVYFKYLFKDQIYQFLTILQQNSRSDEKTLIFKGINNFINKQFVDFLYLKIKENGQGQTFLKLMGIVKNQQAKKNQAVQFLLSLVECKQKQQKNNISNVQQFWTVRSMEDVQMDYQDQCYENKFDNEAIKKRNNKYEQECMATNRNLIQRKYTIQPTQKSTNIYLTEHILFKQWKLYKNGGVLCIDKEAIDVQKQVFKYILAKIGSNIMQRKNILNFSFPVIIFAKQSHLKSVARNFLFAPIFLEKVAKAKPHQKMKAAVLFQISTAMLVIGKSKPFNPILGETYQGFIDGCPIFMQQVSHHPPISNYLLIGRGYKIYGRVQPKIAIGLNCAKGWSPPVNYIQFDDGTIFEFTMNKMVINGILFGERTINFQGMNYIIDYKNKLASEITYGVEANSVFKKKQLTNDSVSGGIYDLSAHNQKISGSNFKKNQKQRLNIFNGIWHSQITMDGKIVYNFTTDFPHMLVDHEYPIPSDGKYRSDIQELIKNDVQNSQKQKQFLQQIQRRDKKLRQQYKKNKKQQ